MHNSGSQGKREITASDIESISFPLNIKAKKDYAEGVADVGKLYAKARSQLVKRAPKDGIPSFSLQASIKPCVKCGHILGWDAPGPGAEGAYVLIEPGIPHYLKGFVLAVLHKLCLFLRIKPPETAGGYPLKLVIHEHGQDVFLIKIIKYSQFIHGIGLKDMRGRQ